MPEGERRDVYSILIAWAYRDIEDMAAYAPMPY